MRIGRTIPPAASPVAIRDILNGLKGLTRGKNETARFQQELKDFFGARHCFLVSSGKAALWVILSALRRIHPDRSEVLIPAYTCYSVPSAIENAGLKATLCDIEADTLDFDFLQLEKIVNGGGVNNCAVSSRNGICHQMKPSSNNMLAVIPTHLFGFPSDIRKVREIVTDPAITIIEDAAQAMGGRLEGKKLGMLGDVGFFSLGRGKSFSTVEGGIILTNRDNLAHEIEKLLHNLPEYSRTEIFILLLYAMILTVFMHPMMFWLPKSLPFLKLGQTIYEPMFPKKKMSAFQAGLSRGWQEKLMALVRIRSMNATHWGKVLSTSPLKARLWLCLEKSDDLKRSPDEDTVIGPIRFPIMIGDEFTAKRLVAIGEVKGLGLSATYPDSIDGVKELKAGFNGRNYPIAKELSRKVMTLPTHGYINAHDKERIAELLTRDSI